MKKKLISMFLAVGMTAALFTGCGSEEADAPAQGGDSQQADSTGDENGEGQQEGQDQAEGDEDMAEITVGWMTMAVLDSSATDAVEDAINAITEEKINTHVDIQFFDPNTYATQIPMMIQGGEQLDLIMYTPVPGAGYASFKNQGQLMEIGSLLEQYAPDVLTMLGDLVGGTSTSEGIYGVSDYRDLSGSYYIIMRKDTLEELNLTEKANSMSTWTEFEEILTEVAAGTELVPIVNCDGQGTVISAVPYFLGDDSFAKNSGFDTLGDTFGLITVDPDTDQVQCYYMTEEYQQMMQRVRDWYQKGLVYKDAATNEEMGDNMIKNDVAFCVAENGELGVENLKETAIGKELVIKKVTDNQITTGTVTKFGFCVPVTAKEPEAAVKFLNLLYTDEQVVSTMAWGVEGRDWVRTDDGMADYPEGVTADTVAYHTADFLNGNQFITIPWAGDANDIRQQQKTSLENSPISKYLGFAFDQSEVQNEITACFNVSEQYKKGLAAGSMDYEVTYSEFTAALEAAGIDKIVAAYQEQLNAWLEAQR
ncbi:MAG: extracellular solute-binding protein [Lachnospiraceae bacterium]|nr:extracellular solute-binding protein [Lachnospiraceae bacterium]